MRLKYYLRGLGLGIAVTATIMSISARKSGGFMTDAQIMARARQLGMVDCVLTEMPDPETEEDMSPEAEGSGRNTGEDDAAILPDAPSGQEAPSEEAVDAKDSSESADGPGGDEGENDSGRTTSASSVIVAIYPGESSYMVSRKLATLGLVESADIYDGFLCQNGYDKKLCTGNYEIKEGATAEEIARIITKNQ